MTTKIINQKEYLKKYLSGKNKDKKKKNKRRPRILGEGLKVIDDDLDLSHLEENEIDLFHLDEDAPQIVGIVDERAPEIKTLDDYRSSNKWKSIGAESVIELDDETNADSSVSKKHEYDSDASPPRNNAGEASPPNRNNNNKRNVDECDDDSDASPPRKYSKGHASSDNSPPRARDNKNNNREDSANSPVRHRSSPRRKRLSSDNSPPRKSGFMERSRRNSRDLSPLRRRSDHEKRNTNNNRDNSPRRRSNFVDDHSRDRRADREYSRRPMNSRVRSRSRSPRFNARDGYSKNDKKQRFEHRSPESSYESTTKMSKTLDGKTAGLQNAKSLKVEAESFRRKEENIFVSMNDEQTGRSAPTIVRDRKTGRRKDLAKEREEDNEKQERDSRRKEKYSRWGKGLKQVEEREARLLADSYEMTKPLARYANDGDLEQHLRSQIHSGDPMLEYMQRKDLEIKVKKGIEVKPLYQGSYPPNRFDIRPGFRWDGVDRSTGYERKYFEAINSRKANEEEAYKWSTEDM